MSDSIRAYRYLNHDGGWPGFTWDGLELGPDGALRLMAVPRLDAAPPARMARLASSQAGAGLAIDRAGTVFFSDAAAAVVYRIDACSGEVAPAPCLGRKGRQPARFVDPSALATPKHRDALYVADTGNARIQVFDLATMALIEVLTGFDRPISLASDDTGNLYVVDAGRKRVDKITTAGDAEPSFWKALLESGCVQDPRAVACDGNDVYVLDGLTNGVTIVDPQGSPIGEIATTIAGPGVIAVIAGAAYIGDPQRQAVAVFRKDHRGVYVRAGNAVGYEGPVAALAGDRAAGLLLLPGGGVPPLRMILDGSYRPEGWLWSGPLRAGEVERYWNRLHADIDLPAGSHAQFFVHKGTVSTPPPPPADGGSLPPPWRAVPGNVHDFFLTFDGRAAEALWVAVRFSNDEHATPAVSQMRVDFDQDSYLSHLPAIYRERAEDDVLLRYVSLFESFFAELEGQIAELPGLLTPAAAAPEALPWLAGFLGLSLPQTWSEQQQRDAIAAAYDSYTRRGTVGGLREAIRGEAGVRVGIVEPLQTAAWWSMPALSTGCRPGGAGTWVAGSDAILGFNTVLASAEAEGAVVGTTATFDRSHVISTEQYGMPLFEGVAHRFVVELYPADASCPGKLEQVKAIVDREKPAHTSYDVCVIAPGIRVGYQARLGVDTLLGGGPSPSRLGDARLVLAGQERGQIGIRSHVGVSTQL